MYRIEMYSSGRWCEYDRTDFLGAAQSKLIDWKRNGGRWRIVKVIEEDPK